MNASMDDINMLEEALSYVKRGYKIFPLHTPNTEGLCSCGNLKCENIGKHPRYESGTLEHGLKDATSDESKIRHWWRKWPDANIGLLTGEIDNLVVLDIDNEEGYEALAKLIQAHGQIQSTYKVKTTRGEHRYFAHPLNGTKIKSISALGGFKGLDVRADGGYVVAANSLRRDGKRYSSTQSLLKDNLAAIPEWLLGLMQSSHTTLSGFNKSLDCTLSDSKKNVPVAEILEGVKEGERDNSIFRLACKLRRADIPKEIAIKLVLDAASKCTPPFPIDQTIKKVETVYTRYPAGTYSSSLLTENYGDLSFRSFMSLDSLHDFTITDNWPKPIPEEGYYGVVGEIVRLIEPHTESDVSALMLQLLIAFGNVLGRHAYFLVESTRHYTNLYGALVGQTAKGRKGTAWAHVKRIITEVDAFWAQERVLGGLSSGEGLIHFLRDVNLGESSTSDSSVELNNLDRRMLVVESEFGGTLQILQRDKNSLSAILRQGWDYGDLRVLTKNSPLKATGAHLSCIFHITKADLTKYFTNTDAANGFGNRILWVLVRRSKCLPEGGDVTSIDFSVIIKKLHKAIEFANNPSRIAFDKNAKAIWYSVYPELSKGAPGLFGSVTSRAEAQVIRLALLYALLDTSPLISKEHLLAALAIWEYCEASSRCIFGSSIGDSIADKILGALKDSEAGMTRTDIRDLFKNNKNSLEIDRALHFLLEADLVFFKLDDFSNGRPAERWFTKKQSTTETTETTEGQH